MGNCLHRSRGDGGGAHCGKNRAALAAAAEEEMHEISEKAPAPAPAPVTEVKIRITRKQLEDLLRRLDEKDSGGAVVVSQLLRMTSSSSFRHSRGQAVQWRPALHSIPE